MNAPLLQNVNTFLCASFIWIFKRRIQGSGKSNRKLNSTEKKCIISCNVGFAIGPPLEHDFVGVECEIERNYLVFTFDP